MSIPQPGPLTILTLWHRKCQSNHRNMLKMPANCNNKAILFEEQMSGDVSILNVWKISLQQHPQLHKCAYFQKDVINNFALRPAALLALLCSSHI